VLTLFEPSIRRAREAEIHDDYIVSDLEKIDELYEANSFDAVIALDVIEHLEKNEGLAMLQKMELLARRRVVIFTPNGFLPQGNKEDNVYQVHRSGWTVDEFRELGYTVVGIRGLKFLGGELASIRFRPHFFWQRLS